MSSPLDEEYLTWLYAQVASTRFKAPHRTFWSLLRQLYSTEFVWFVPNDDNRAEDGRDLRYEFTRVTNHIPTRDWMELPCSILEMVIGLSRRLSFEAGGQPRDWFWHLLKNLNVSKLTDEVYGELVRTDVDDILDRLNYRRYGRDGVGGLFPLQNPRKNQTKVELWYQLSAYLLERE